MTSTTQPAPTPKRKTLSGEGRRVKQAPRRTTVTLSTETSEIVERFKAATGASTSRAIEELILRGEPQKSYLIEKDGFLLLDAPLKGGKITTEDVKRLLEESPW